MDRDRRRKARLTPAGFLVLPEDVTGDRIVLRGAEAHHAARVCRCQPGDGLDAADGAGMYYRCRVVSCSAGVAEAEILERLPEHGEPKTRVTLAVAPVKGERFDWLVEKAVEAGASEILPILTTRSVVEPGAKHDRWRRIALAAMKQSKRSCLTDVAETIPFPEALSGLSARVDRLLIAHEDADAALTLSQVLPSFPVASVGLLIGPEGGFTDKEVSAACALGARPFSLGPRRLRTETAGVLTVALVLHEFGKRDESF